MNTFLKICDAKMRFQVVCSDRPSHLLRLIRAIAVCLPSHCMLSNICIYIEGQVIFTGCTCLCPIQPFYVVQPSALYLIMSQNENALCLV